jgi:DsbC/DsbD-like thiol-disulfide interchange protein
MSRFMFRQVILTACALALALLPALAARAQAIRSDSKVKVTATADKPGTDGKQVVTITLLIENGWHTYANPVGGKDFPGLPTTVTITAKEKPEKVTVDYPKGKMMKDDTSGAYFVYEAKTTIKATVQRAKRDTSPLEVAVKIQACSDKSCLQPATVNLTVK